MDRRVKSLLGVCVACFAGAAVGSVHRSYQVGEEALIGRLDRVQEVSLASIRRAAAPEEAPAIQELPKISIPKIERPKRPDPRKVPKPVEPAPRREPIPSILEPLPAPNRVPETPPVAATRPSPRPSGPIEPPVVKIGEDDRIESLLKEAKQAQEAGRLEQARRQAEEAASLPGSPDRVAEAKEEAAFLRMAAELLPDRDRWKDIYVGGWVRLRGAGPAIEGRLLSEDDRVFVIGKANGKLNVPKTEVNKVDRFSSSSLRSRFEREAREKASAAVGDDEAIRLFQAAKFAWERNLPVVALDLLREASAADPDLSRTIGELAARAAEPTLPAATPSEPVAQTPVEPPSGPAETPDPTPAEAPPRPDPPLPPVPAGRGSVRAASALYEQATSARHAGDRDRSLQLANQAVAMLRPLLKGPERKDALLVLGQLEHGIASVYLVRKDYATAYTHYKNSDYCLQVGGYPIKRQMAGNLARIQQMTAVLGKRVPPWTPPPL